MKEREIKIGHHTVRPVDLWRDLAALRMDSGVYDVLTGEENEAIDRVAVILSWLAYVPDDGPEAEVPA